MQGHEPSEKKSRKFCSVPQCSSYCGGNVSLHKFPLRDTKLCKIWRNVLKIGKPITQNMHVCSKHFIPEDFLNSNGNWTIKRKPPKLLKKTAVPSVNIPKSSHETKRSERRKLIKHDETDKKDIGNHCEHSESQVVQNDGELMEPQIKPIINEDIQVIPDEDDMELMPSGIEHVNNIMVDTSTQTAEYIFQLPQILDTDEKLRCFTGVDYKTLKAYKKCVENVASANDVNLFSIEFSIILVLSKIKTNISFGCLALLFGLSVPMCTKIFHSTVNLLASDHRTSYLLVN